MPVSSTDQIGDAGRNAPPDLRQFPNVATKEDFEQFHADVMGIFNRFNRWIMWYLTGLMILYVIALL